MFLCFQVLNLSPHPNAAGAPTAPRRYIKLWADKVQLKNNLAINKRYTISAQIRSRTPSCIGSHGSFDSTSPATDSGPMLLHTGDFLHEESWPALVRMWQSSDWAMSTSPLFKSKRGEVWWPWWPCDQATTSDPVFQDCVHQELLTVSSPLCKTLTTG